MSALLTAARQTAADFAAASGTAHDLVPCTGGNYAVIADHMADQLYPGRACYRVFPDGSGVALLHKVAA